MLCYVMLCINDLSKKINYTEANLVEIISTIKEISPNTEIAFSNICIRKDDPTLEKSRIQLNESIKNVSRDFNLDTVDHGNIDKACLSRKKLHLNTRYGIPRQRTSEIILTVGSIEENDRWTPCKISNVSILRIS